MRSIPIQFELSMGDLFEFVGGPKGMSPGHKIDLPGGAQLEIRQVLERRGAGATAVVSTILTFGSGVAAGVVANWLTSRLSGKTRTIEIERVKIELKSGEIERLLVERTRVSE